MYIDGAKIRVLFQAMERINYPEKSYTAMFWNLNYNQWNAYTRGAQVVGNKITLRLMEIFQT
jgi:hypothetical protein